MPSLILPFSYLFYSRLKSGYEKLSWFAIYPVPVLLLITCVNGWRGLAGYVAALLAICAFYSIYELGYLENDLVTTRKELNATLRSDPDQQTKLESRYVALRLYRIVFAAATLIAIYVLDTNYHLALNPLLFAFCLGLTRLVFYVHNSVRSRINVLTYFFLSHLKYLSPIALVLSNRQIVDGSRNCILDVCCSQNSGTRVQTKVRVQKTRALAR